MNISVLLFDEAELLDWAGPAEVFSAASRFVSEPVNIGYFGYGSERVTAGNLKFYANGLWEQVTDIRVDLVIVPGGSGVKWVKTDKTRSLLNSIYESGSEIASVCTGALLLAHAGLLTGREATTHHENFDQLKQLAPGCEIKKEARYTYSPPVFTAGGVTAGIDLAISLVARKWGTQTAQRTAEFIEYPLHGTQKSAF